MFMRWKNFLEASHESSASIILKVGVEILHYYLKRVFGCLLFWLLNCAFSTSHLWFMIKTFLPLFVPYRILISALYDFILSITK